MCGRVDGCWNTGRRFKAGDRRAHGRIRPEDISSKSLGPTDQTKEEKHRTENVVEAPKITKKGGSGDTVGREIGRMDPGCVPSFLSHHTYRFQSDRDSDISSYVVVLFIQGKISVMNP